MIGFGAPTQAPLDQRARDAAAAAQAAVAALSAPICKAIAHFIRTTDTAFTTAESSALTSASAAVIGSGLSVDGSSITVGAGVSLIRITCTEAGNNASGAKSMRIYVNGVLAGNASRFQYSAAGNNDSMFLSMAVRVVPGDVVTVAYKDAAFTSLGNVALRAAPFLVVEALS